MPRVKTLHGGRVVTNVLGSSAAKPPGHSSFIALWRAETGLADAPCFAKGCPNRGTHGGHVKLAPSAVAGALLLSFDWFIVPACPAHNKRASCGSYAVKPHTRAVRCNPTVLERVAALPADGRKLVAACLGKHHI